MTPPYKSYDSSHYDSVGAVPLELHEKKKAWCMVHGTVPLFPQPSLPHSTNTNNFTSKWDLQTQIIPKTPRFFRLFWLSFFSFSLMIYIYICPVLIETNILQAISILIMVHEVTHLKNVIAQAPPVLLILWQDEYLQSLNVVIFNKLND